MTETALYRHLISEPKGLSDRQDLCDLLTSLDRSTVWRSLFRGVAHELSNTSQVFTLNDPTDFTDHETAAEWKSTIEWATDKLTSAITVLREFAKVQGATGVPVIVADVITTVQYWQRYQRAQPPVPMRVEIASDLPPIDASESYLRQVLLALIANAKEAVGDSDEAEITIAATEDGGMVHIAVEDNGPGIPNHMNERIFEPFFTTKDPTEHLGLGATIARHLAESWGGALLVQQPSQNQGSRMVVCLREWGAAPDRMTA
jgi:C4-dicarboxylate-specific signal transduction histidine kinase